MRFFLLALLMALVAIVSAVKEEQKPVLITFPDNTPPHEINRAMDVIREAGGMITHEYKLIKGFAASASSAALQTIKTLGEEFVPFIEEDSMVSIDGSVIEGKSQ